MSFLVFVFKRHLTVRAVSYSWLGGYGWVSWRGEGVTAISRVWFTCVLYLTKLTVFMNLASCGTVLASKYSDTIMLF